MGETFEDRVAAYLRDFPYQETYRYASLYTGGDPGLLNTWYASTPALLKAGEDKVVRSNNDTFYKAAFIYLMNGPVALGASVPAEDRFVSFQLMDDRNANYRNVIYPHGSYTLYHREVPEDVVGEAIAVPSVLSLVLVRVEVRDPADPVDVAAATKVYEGITLEGPAVSTFPELDLRSQYPREVIEEANKRMDYAFANEPFGVVGPGQKPGVDVPFVNHSAGTKGGWGGPAREHSDYETLQSDDRGEAMMGRNGTYTLTTEEPPVDGFWSVTVYDTERGGFFHPNSQDRYHINNTTAERNDDGTVTFMFKTSCDPSDKNCIEVPEGQFDVAARYYAPKAEILTGGWRIPRPALSNT